MKTKRKKQKVFASGWWCMKNKAIFKFRKCNDGKFKKDGTIAPHVFVNVVEARRKP